MSIISLLAAAVFFTFFSSFAVLAIKDAKYSFAFFLIVFASLPALLLWLESKRVAAEKEFPQWILVNMNKLSHSQAKYKGIRVNTLTKMVRYEACISVVAASFKFHSPWYIKGHDGAAKTIYCLITFFLGWWGLPWGPVFTLQCLNKNMNGGETASIRDFI